MPEYVQPGMVPRDNGVSLDRFNEALRASPGWQQFIRARFGTDPDGATRRDIRLTDQQRRELRTELERAGVQFPRGMEIDPAGNVNQDQGVSRHWNNPWIRWPVIGGAALATMGAAGYGPLAGIFGGGGGGAAAGGAAGAAGGGAATGAGPAGATIINAAGIPTTAAYIGAGGPVPPPSGTGNLWGRIGRFLSGPTGSQLISTGGGLIATGIQARADGRAADAQERALNRALDFEERVYADDRAFFEPYAELGRGSVARLSDMTSQRRDPLSADSVFASGRLGAPAPTSSRPTVSELSQRPTSPASVLDLSRRDDGVWGPLGGAGATISTLGRRSGATVGPSELLQSPSTDDDLSASRDDGAWGTRRGRGSADSTVGRADGAEGDGAEGPHGPLPENLPSKSTAPAQPAPMKMVRMTAPTGEQQDVPEELVTHFERLGARRVA